jgi:hypothetical protein
MDRSFHKSHPLLAYVDKYPINLKAAVINEVEATRAIRRAVVVAARTFIERAEKCVGIHPQRLAADNAYGSGDMLWGKVNERAIEPHIPVFDKSAREYGTFARDDFAYVYRCPAGKVLTSTGRQ